MGLTCRGQRLRQTLSALLAGAMLLSFAGCGTRAVKGQGGTPLSAPKEGKYDFAASWVTQRTQMKMVEDETWRLGTVGGRSVKVTAGNTTGVGAWYADTLPRVFAMHFTLSFANVEPDQAASAAVRFGTDKDDAKLSVTAERDDSGAVEISLRQGEDVLCTSGKIKNLKDREFSVILDNTASDNTLKLYVTGDQKFAYYVQSDAIDAAVLDGVSMFSFWTDTAGMVLNNVGVDVLIYEVGDFQEYAQIVFSDLKNHFWDADNNRVIRTHGGKPNNNTPPVWEFGTVLYALLTEYELTGDEAVKAMIAGQWEYMQQAYNENSITVTGRGTNPALDDASWTARILLKVYGITGDQKALAWGGKMLRNSYDYWMDEAMENGLWYSYKKDIENRNEEKTIYDVGLLLAGLEYHEATKGTDLADPALYEDTMKLYHWIETYLRRDKEKTYGDIKVEAVDNLYFNTFYDREDGTFEPGGYRNPDTIAESNSSSSLMGNTAMAVIHQKLYDMTGDEKYKTKAVETANAIANSGYNHNGILVNDFDPWTNVSFMGEFVGKVLTQDGIDAKWNKLLTNTALSIMKRCRTDEGYYKASWENSTVYERISKTGGYDLREDVMMTSVNTMHMVIAAALGEKLGIVK